MRRLRGLLGLVLAVVLVGGCTAADGDQDLLLLPTLPSDLSPVSGSVLSDLLGAEEAAALPDVRSAALLDEVPGDDGRCGADQEDRWTSAPVDSRVVAVPGVGFTYSRSGPVGEGTLTVVCDLDADGTLLVADELSTTGTDEAVGNDYVARVGTIAGRVDLGVPDGAIVALQQFDAWTLLIPVDDLAIVRLHALRGGGPTDGFDIGQVRFLTADGRDVTPESLPIPDVIHGVPRSHGSGVPTGD